MSFCLNITGQRQRSICPFPPGETVLSCFPAVLGWGPLYSHLHPVSGSLPLTLLDPTFTLEPTAASQPPEYPATLPLGAPNSLLPPRPRFYLFLATGGIQDVSSQTRLRTKASCSGSSLPCTLPTALWLSYQPQSKTLVFWRPNSNGYLCNFPSDTKVCLATRQAMLLARGRGEEKTSAGDSRVPRPKPAFILYHGGNTARPGPLFWVGFTPYQVGANASRLPSRLGTQSCPQFQPCSQTPGAEEHWGRSSTGTAGTT